MGVFHASSAAILTMQVSVGLGVERLCSLDRSGTFDTDPNPRYHALKTWFRGYEYGSRTMPHRNTFCLCDKTKPHKPTCLKPSRESECPRDWLTLSEAHSSCKHNCGIFAHPVQYSRWEGSFSGAVVSHPTLFRGRVGLQRGGWATRPVSGGVRDQGKCRLSAGLANRVIESCREDFYVAFRSFQVFCPSCFCCNASGMSESRSVNFQCR